MPRATGRLSPDGAVAVGTGGAPAVDDATREFRGAERHVIAPLLGASPERKSGTAVIVTRAYRSPLASSTVPTRTTFSAGTPRQWAAPIVELIRRGPLWAAPT